MKYAVIQSGGKQYKVSEGDIIEVERLESKPSEEILFDKVLLYVSNEPRVFEVGRPHLKEITVKGKVLEEKRGKKIRVSKFKAKVRYRKTIGHRQSLSKVSIEKIDLKSKKEEVSLRDKKIKEPVK